MPSESHQTHLYDRWITPQIEPEDVDCSNCWMTDPEKHQRATGLQPRDRGPFDAKLKCCTYLPFLPNFSIGSLLKSGTENQIQRLRQALKRGLWTPLGLIPHESDSQFLAEGFGKDPKKLCSFFSSESGSCTIWNHRPGVCSTYFCFAKQGQRHLSGVEERLSTFELSLAHMVLWQLGLTLEETSQCESEEQWWEFNDRDHLMVRCYEQSLLISKDEMAETLGL